MPYKVTIILKDGSTETFVYTSNDIAGTIREYLVDPATEHARQNTERVELQQIVE